MRGLLARQPGADTPSEAAPEDDDALLVVAARADPYAFAPLYTRYVDPVYRYCFRRLGDREAAADATSLIFTKALAGLPGYRDGASSFRSWLFAIAHNVVVDAARAHHPTSPLEDAAGLRTNLPSPEEQVLTHETESLIRQLLSRLSPEQRQIMELRLAGLTGPEIAVAVGRSLGAVKIAQVRAFARMRADLNRDGDPGEGRADDWR